MIAMSPMRHDRRNQPAIPKPGISRRAPERPSARNVGDRRYGTPVPRRRTKHGKTGAPLLAPSSGLSQAPEPLPSRPSVRIVIENKTLNVESFAKKSLLRRRRNRRGVERRGTSRNRQRVRQRPSVSAQRDEKRRDDLGPRPLRRAIPKRKQTLGQGLVQNRRRRERGGRVRQRRRAERNGGIKSSQGNRLPKGLVDGKKDRRHATSRKSLIHSRQDVGQTAARGGDGKKRTSRRRRKTLQQTFPSAWKKLRGSGQTVKRRIIGGSVGVIRRPRQQTEQPAGAQSGKRSQSGGNRLVDALVKQIHRSTRRQPSAKLRSIVRRRRGQGRIQTRA